HVGSGGADVGDGGHGDTPSVMRSMAHGVRAAVDAPPPSISDRDMSRDTFRAWRACTVPHRGGAGNAMGIDSQRSVWRRGYVPEAITVQARRVLFRRLSAD